MKKMYTVGMYSTGDLTREQLKDIFSKAGGFKKAVYELVGKALDDPDPMQMQPEDTEAKAESHMNSSISISENTWAVHSWNITFSGIMEIWTADDDGDFLDGSDYDWSYTDSQLEELKALYDDTMGIDREEA